MERDFDWNDGHTVECADDALLSCMIWQTSVDPINSIQQTKSPHRFGVGHTLVGLLAQLLADFVVLDISPPLGAHGVPIWKFQ